MNHVLETVGAVLACLALLVWLTEKAVEWALAWAQHGWVFREWRQSRARRRAARRGKR